jgi:hypothetical protein
VRVLRAEAVLLLLFDGGHPCRKKFIFFLGWQEETISLFCGHWPLEECLKAFLDLFPSESLIRFWRHWQTHDTLECPLQDTKSML